MAGFSTDETVGRVVLNAPLPPERELVWGGQPNPYSVRNLAYLALCETTKIPEEAEYVGCATCVITRGVSSIRVSSRRLVVPTQDMDL